MTDKAPDQTPEAPARNKQKLSFRQLIASVLAAGLGVQSEKNRERDFKHGNAKVYIVAGLIFTLLFIAGVATVVNLVLPE